MKILLPHAALSRASFLCKARYHTSSSRRCLLSQAYVPDPHNSANSSIPEKPCTLILAEDDGLYATTSSSWHDPWHWRLPDHYGISYQKWNLSNSPSEHEMSLDVALSEMKADLASIPDAVLLARGPWSSWLAQFYLESLSLAGLVMVDPLPLDDAQGVKQFEMLYKQRGLQDSVNYQMFQEYVNHWDHWTLKLEPGAVPMLVIQSAHSSLPCRHLAQKTAQRHSGAMFGEVPIVSMEADMKDEQVLEIVCDWIDHHVI